MKEVTVNTKSLALVTLLAVVGATASAQEATPWPELDNLVSHKARAEVKAELAQARAKGFAFTGGEATIFRDAPVVGTRDRAAVRAEARAAAKARAATPAASQDPTAGLMYVGG